MQSSCTKHSYVVSMRYRLKSLSVAPPSTRTQARQKMEVSLNCKGFCNTAIRQSAEKEDNGADACAFR